MYYQEHAGEHVAALLRTKLDGDVAHSIGGNSVSRFTTAYPFTRDGVAVSTAVVIDTIENEGFQLRDFQNSGLMGRARIDARPADLDTFVVDRIGMQNGKVFLMGRGKGRVLQFDASIADRSDHLAMTQAGDTVTLLSMHSHERITGFRNRTIEKAELQA